MNMENELLSQAIELIKSGKKAEAKKMLENFLTSDKHNITGWLWYAEIWSTDEQRIKALELGLRQNPNNPKLLQAIETLRSRNVQNTTTINKGAVNEPPTQPKQHLTKICPYCAETIKYEAIVCRFCGRDLRTGQLPHSQLPIQIPKQKEWNPGVAALLSFIIPGAGSIYKGKVGTGILWLILTAGGYALFVIPGIIFHIMAIADAYNGNPYKTGG